MTFDGLEIGQEFYENNTLYRKISYDRGDGQGWAVNVSSGNRVSFSGTDRIWISPVT